MTDFSIKEAEMLCFKAARGAGYSWGLAEEAGFAAGWLAKRGLSGLDDFAEHLYFLHNRDPGKLVPAEPDDIWASPSGPLCPISSGSFLSDYCREMDWDRPVNASEMDCPLFLLPFAATASMAIERPLCLAFDGFSAIVLGDRIEILQNTAAGGQSRVSQISLTPAPRMPEDNVSITDRIVLDDETLNRLTEFAAKTYVPETEELKASGAGGEKVDDDE